MDSGRDSTPLCSDHWAHDSLIDLKARGPGGTTGVGPAGYHEKIYIKKKYFGSYSNGLHIEDRYVPLTTAVIPSLLMLMSTQTQTFGL